MTRTHGVPYMPFHHPYIVCFGRDQMLLNTRCHLLEQAGYVALSTSSELTVAKCLLNGSVTVLILCHTLSSWDVEVICRFHREMHSNASILSLSLGEWKPSLDHGQSYDAQKGPAAFLAAVTQFSSMEHHHMAA